MALFVIFLTHMPGHEWANWTLRRWGFSDAAEAFVLLAGLAAGLAYARLDGPHLWKKGWNRALTLALAHWGLTVAAVGLAGTFAALGWPSLAERHGLAPLLEGSLAHWAGVVFGGHQVGYVNILTLYVALLALCPALLMGMRRSIGWTLAASGALWMLAGSAHIGPAAWPTEGGWQFNPLAWQFLFAIGLAATQPGFQAVLRPVPKHALTLLAAFVVAGALSWRVFPTFGSAMKQDLSGLVAGVPALGHALGFFKPDLGGMRLLHALALAWLVFAIPGTLRGAAAPILAPFRTMGRNGLAVFCAGTLLSLAGQALILDGPAFTGRDALMAMAGLACLATVAHLAERRKRQQRTTKPTQVNPAPPLSQQPTGTFPQRNHTA